MNYGKKILFGKFGSANIMSEYFKGKKILVTGGAGLVGSHLTEKLAAIGAEVFVLDILVRPKSYFETQALEKKSKLLNVDLADLDGVKKTVSENEIEFIFHLGAQALVPEAFINPHRTFESNVMGTVNVLEAARLNRGVRAVVVASSDKAYGKDCVNVTEDHALSGDHPYDVSKSATDLISTTYFKTYGLPVTVSRFGNIFGPGDLNFDRIVPGIMSSLIKSSTLEIRSNGEFRRDYVYVKDVVDGYLALAENIDKTKGEAFNFSSGINLSVLEIIEEASKALGKKIDFKILNNQKNEIPEQSLNFDKVQKLIGWKSGNTLEQGLVETYNWYKKYFGKN